MVVRSKGCEFCRARKIRCDRLKPICTQCRKGGWRCGGYRTSDSNWIFYTSTVRTLERPAPPTSPRAVYPPITDQGLGFFMSNYVIPEPNNRAAFRGFHDYLPILCRQESSRQTLSTIMSAVGMAGLANAGKQPAVTLAGRKMQVLAIRRIREALADPLEIKSDNTLAAIMLLSTFEAVTCHGPQSMQRWSTHVSGLAHLLNVRGPDQLKTPESAKLFHQARRLIVIGYSSMGIPIPDPLRRWPEMAKTSQLKDNIPADQYLELMEELVNAKAWIKMHPEVPYAVKASMLLQIDAKFESWAQNVPADWQYQTVARQSVPNCSTFELRDHIYSDLWVSSTWTGQRTARIQLHQMVINLYRNSTGIPEVEQRRVLRRSRDVLIKMTEEICQSVSFHIEDSLDSTQASNELTPVPGAYVLNWQLFMVGMLETTTAPQRCWIAERLRRIAIRSGNRQPLVFSNALFAIKDVDSRIEIWRYLDEEEAKKDDQFDDAE